MNIFYDSDKSAIDKHLINDLVSEIDKILSKSQFCNIAIAGGRSISSVLDRLVLEKLDWNRLRVFVVDDRCLPIEDEESNSYLVKKHLADKVPVNFYPFTYNPDAKDRGASEYSRILKNNGGKLDLLILSAGEDGHTAGLFPNNQGIKSEKEGYVFIDDSPKPPAERVSITKNTFLSSKGAFIVFVGEGKKEAYRKFIDQNTPIEACPSKLVHHLSDIFVYTDILDY